MIRRTAVALFLAATVLAPEPAVADGGAGQQPLMTVCLSHAREYCAAFLTWDIEPFECCPDFVTWSFTGLAGGSVFESGQGSFLLSVYWPDGNRSTTSPVQSDGSFWGGDQPISRPDLAGATIQETLDVVGFHTLDSDGTLTGLRTCSRFEGTCVEVPEPSTYLLLLSGVFGLGFVAWRRKENQAA